MCEKCDGMTPEQKTAFRERYDKITTPEHQRFEADVEDVFETLRGHSKQINLSMSEAIIVLTGMLMETGATKEEIVHHILYNKAAQNDAGDVVH